MTNAETDLKTFILRLVKERPNQSDSPKTVEENKAEPSQTGPIQQTKWRITLQNVQDNEKVHFASINDLVHYLEQIEH